MSRVFISYKRADKDIVFPLKDKIEAAIGEPCWIDLEGIDCELKEWEDVVIKAINEASVFIFVYSKTLSEVVDFEDDRTFDEFSYAREKKKRIVFVNIDATPLTDRFAFRFGARQQVDATSNEALERLIQDLKSWLSLDFRVDNLTYEPSTNFTKELRFDFDDKNHTAIVKGISFGSGRNIVIPDVVLHNGRNYPITEIMDRAFNNASSVTSIVIPNGVKRIGNEAFRACHNLTSINIPNSVTYIGERAFYDCKKLNSIFVPKSVTYYGYWAFPENCKTIHEE